MARVVSGGEAAFQALTCGEVGYDTIEFARNQLSQGWDNLTDAGKAFMSGAKQVFEEAFSDEALQRTRSILRRRDHVWKSDTISVLNDVGAIQQAGSIMRRWVMANPDVRKRYHDERCAGYGDLYRDAEPGKVGMDHYDYRRVVNGIGMVHHDTEGEHLEHVSIFETEVPEDDNLAIDQQTDILLTWDAVNHCFKRGIEDPTSPENDRL